MPDERNSLLSFMYYLLDDTHEISIGKMFIFVDSYITTFLLLFLAGWILSILVGLGKDGFK